MGKLIFILGGARSGKSSYAETRAVEMGGDKVLYVATAEAKDEEMAERIKMHRTRRPAGWQTLEAAQNIAGVIMNDQTHPKVILIDCLSMLVSNILVTHAAPESAHTPTIALEKVIDPQVHEEIEALLSLIKQNEANFVIVSNEVGMGLVPAYEMGRLYRDILGRANQKIARAADEVIFMVSGLPMQVK